MEHFSVPAVVFSRKKQNRFPQRNEPSSAKTKLFCRKALPAGAERGEKQGFGRLFPLWMKSARVQTPFVLLQAIPLTGPTRGAGSGRTAFRGGRQNVAETDFRLSSCISLGARGSRISVPFPSRARLRGSRSGCLDVLTECYWGTVAVRCPLGAFAAGGGRRHRNMQGSARGASFFPSRNRWNIWLSPLDFYRPVTFWVW